MKLKEKHIQIFALCSLVITLCLITVFSLMSANNIKEIGLTFNDKMMHFLAYTALGFSLFLTTKNYILTICSGFVFSLLIEILQKYNSRYMEGADLIANFCGLVIGILCVKLFLALLRPILERG